MPEHMPEYVTATLIQTWQENVKKACLSSKSGAPWKVAVVIDFKLPHRRKLKRPQQ